MPVLVAKFRYVFYVAGNHELWHDAATDGVDSFEKLLTIYELITALGAPRRRPCSGQRWW